MGYLAVELRTGFGRLCRGAWHLCLLRNSRKKAAGNNAVLEVVAYVIRHRLPPLSAVGYRFNMGTEGGGYVADGATGRKAFIGLTPNYGF